MRAATSALADRAVWNYDGLSTAAMTAPTIPEQPQPIPPATHVGILVIHGMGEENPYDTVDQFARGVYDEVRAARPAAGYVIQTEWRERAAGPAFSATSWTQAQLKFVPTLAAPSQATPEYLLSEYYWSPLTKDKVKDLDVIYYLIRAGLSPFRYLAENLRVLTAVGKQTTAASLEIISREVIRQIFVFLPFLASFLVLGVVLIELPEISKVEAAKALNAAAGYWPVLVVLRLLLLGSIGGYLWELVTSLRRKTKCSQPPTSPSPAGSWIIRWQWLPAVVLFLALLLFPLFPWAPHGTLPAISPLSHGVGWWHVAWAWIVLAPTWLRFLLTRLSLILPAYAPFFWPVAGLSFAALVRNFLIDFLGDVVIYTNLNQRAANFSVRTQVLEECGTAVLNLYSDLKERATDGDFAVVIAAHSLGTVIAYDAVTDLFNRARIQPYAPVVAPGAGNGAPALVNNGDQPSALEVCQKLRGLFTFGSPLNKTYYLFRDISAPRMVVRAQIVDGLHSFRLLAADTLPPCYQVKPVPIDDELAALQQAFIWINAWSPLDPFCGHLYFYDLRREGNQARFWYWIPILAHLKYWEDPNVYKFFAERLL
jgi:hypothetical protein